MLSAVGTTDKIRIKYLHYTFDLILSDDPNSLIMNFVKRKIKKVEKKLKLTGYIFEKSR